MCVVRTAVTVEIQLTSWTRVLAKKLIVAQLLKKILTFHRIIRRFVIFIRESPSLDFKMNHTNPIHTPANYLLYLRCSFILSSQLHQGFPYGVFPSYF